MLELPKRASLIPQIAETLRQAISEGLWQECLPGERELADRFQVSRPTLREALKLLQREGIVDVVHGKRRRILLKVQHPRRSSRNVVAAITQDPPHLMAPLTIFYMNELRKHIQEAGLQLEILTDRRLNSSKPEKLLEGKVRDEKVACWILLSVTQQIQSWFDQRGLPALVVGSCYPEIAIPSLDIDYRAICRHAVGEFLRKGHRRLAFLTPATKVAGDEASEEGFLTGVADSGHTDANATFFRHDGTREDICRKLDRLLRAPARPTGLLISRPFHLLTAFTYLLQKGLSLPGDLSIISRDNDTYLSCLYPDIARYSYRRRHFAQRLARLIIQLATTGSLPKREHRLIPQFHSGTTVAPPPSDLCNPANR